MEIVITLVFRILAALVVMMIREAVKGITAYFVTHPVYRDQVDLTYNWFKYVDPIGVMMMIFMFFGWQKPFDYKSSRFRNKNQGLLLVSLSGFMANILLIVIIIPALKMDISPYLGQFLRIVVQFSLSITVVNLLPIPPLDMSRIIQSISPNSYLSLVRYESILHIGFVVFIAIGFGTVMMSGLYDVLQILIF